MAIPTVAKIGGPQAKPFLTVIGQAPNIWKIGYISLVAADRLPLGAVTVATNVMQRQEGVWGTRWGTVNFGPEYTGPITGITDYAIYNSNGTVTNGILILDNGTLKYTTNLTSWTTITGHTFNTSVWTNMLQFENKILLCNGKDAFSYVDLTDYTWYGFTGISAPSGVSATLGSGLTSGGNQITYVVTASTDYGETAMSNVVTEGVNIDRAFWWNPQSTGSISSSTNYIQLSWAQVAGAVGYTIYGNDNEAGVYYELAQISDPGGTGHTITYTDFGIQAYNNFAQAPTTDTTTAPAFNWISLSDNRLWATGDPNHLNRIYFASSQQNNNLAFNAFLGGGWVDILPGGRQIPTYVGQFRNGQGSPMTTILLSDPTGYGSTWNCQLAIDTIANESIVVPNLVESLSTFGSGSPRGVILTNQNVYFHSGGPAGVYTTGSVPTLFNVLSTNEITILVRTDMQSIPLNNLPNITGMEYDRKLFYSWGLGQNTNNVISVYDLEKETWVINAFTFGVQQFIRFADSDGKLHLLGVRTSPTHGNYLQDFSESYTTDNGNVIQSELSTGLIHLSPDHTQYGFCQYSTTEFGPSYGDVRVILAGTPYNGQFQELYSETASLGSVDVNTGYSSAQYSYQQYSATTFSIVSNPLADKKTIRMKDILNNYQMTWSNDTQANMVINQHTMQGVRTPIPPESDWIMN